MGMVIPIGIDPSKSVFVFYGVDQQEHCQLKRIEVAAVIFQETAMSYYQTAKTSRVKSCTHSSLEAVDAIQRG